MMIMTFYTTEFIEGLLGKRGDALDMGLQKDCKSMPTFRFQKIGISCVLTVIKCNKKMVLLDWNL